MREKKKGRMKLNFLCPWLSADEGYNVLWPCPFPCVHVCACVCVCVSMPGKHHCLVNEDGEDQTVPDSRFEEESIFNGVYNKIHRGRGFCLQPCRKPCSDVLQLPCRCRKSKIGAVVWCTRFVIVSASLKQWGCAHVLAILPKKGREKKIELVLLLQSALFSEIKQRTCSAKTPFLPALWVGNVWTGNKSVSEWNLLRRKCSPEGAQSAR